MEYVANEAASVSNSNDECASSCAKRCAVNISMSATRGLFFCPIHLAGTHVIVGCLNKFLRELQNHKCGSAHKCVAEFVDTLKFTRARTAEPLVSENRSYCLTNKSGRWLARGALLVTLVSDQRHL